MTGHFEFVHCDRNFVQCDIVCFEEYRHFGLTPPLIKDHGVRSIKYQKPRITNLDKTLVMQRISILWVFVILISACGSRKIIQIAMEDKKEFKYLALGDSYTIGESVDPGENFPELLASELRSQGVNIKRPQIVATTGWTTTDLEKGILEAPAGEFEYDMVSLLIGVNDQYQGKPIEQYEPNLTKLIEIAIDLAAGNKDRVFILSIPDYAFTPFGQERESDMISKEIDTYNEINKKIADQYNILYFDITDLSRQGLSRPSLIAGDNLHPSKEMYKEWVDLMSEEVCSRFVK